MIDFDINNITIEGDNVYLTSVDNDSWEYPLEATWEYEIFSEVLREQGREALYAKIGEELWSGELFLTEGGPLCNLFLKAKSLFPEDMNFRTFDVQTAGSLLGEMVSSWEQNPDADLSEFVNRAMALRDNRDYILDTARREGMNYLNYARKEVQADRAFALKVLHAGEGAAWFQYPSYYSEDKDFALEALRINGCFYRELGDELKADRDVILEAFRQGPEKELHEFLPDLIPPKAYCKPVRGGPPQLDKAFIFQLLDLCPSMHIHREPRLLADREVVMKWVSVGTFFPHRFIDLPEKYIQDAEIQNALIHRFQNTDDYKYLLQYFEMKGVQIPETSLNTRIHSAVARSGAAISTSSPEKEHDK